MSTSNLPSFSNNADGRLPKEYAFPFLIAAKAAVLDSPKWSGSDGWWQKEGNRWLESMSLKLKVPLDSLPSNPTPLDVTHFAHAIPSSEHHATVLSLLSACLLPSASPSKSKQGNQPAPLNYTPATRALLWYSLSLLQIPHEHLLVAEDHVSQGLYAELKNAEMKAKSEAARKEQSEGWGGKWGRLAATVGGVIIGGVAIGMTGGLAAPALLPLLPFLTAGSAPIVLGTLFGLTGGGLAGLRVNKRWAGVDVFDFVQIVGGGEDSDPDSVARNKDTGSVEKAQAPSLVATIVIPGLLIEKETEALDGLRACTDLFSAPRRDTFVLNHSPQEMLSAGRTLHNWVMNKLLGKVKGKIKGEIIKRAALSTVYGVVALPMSIYQTTGMVVDNEWIRACDRAKKAGRLLAEVLQKKVQGDRPIVLIGVSLGALTLFEALTTIAEHSTPEASPLLDTAIFISLPAAPGDGEWKQVRSAVARRLVNAYCTTDLVLAGVGRLHEVLGGGGWSDMAGLRPIGKEGIEDVDLSDVIDGHFELNPKIKEVLDAVAVND
ncbi:hypothetical protein FRC00_008704 [Tulasnella sp. 408]|nr:hypothetical protein FRC00_008704 [Tulasnella sp. 408]